MLMSTFTLAQANRALAYVRPICEELRQAHVRFSDLRRSLLPQNSPLGEERGKLIDELNGVKDLILRGCDELEKAGVQVKSLERGLVDFPYKRADGQIVLLCWILGEGGISHWHDRETGFGGRQPLDTLETAPVSSVPETQS